MEWRPKLSVCRYLSSALHASRDPRRASEHARLHAAEEAIHRMIAGQEAHGRSAANAEIREPPVHRLVLGIDHQRAPQEADRIGLEVETEIDAREIQIEIGVVELLPNRGARELDGAQELASNQRQRERVRRAEARVLGVYEIGAAQVLESLVTVPGFEQRQPAAVVLLRCELTVGLHGTCHRLPSVPSRALIGRTPPGMSGADQGRLAYSPTGKRAMNSTRPASRSSAQARPPCSSTIARTTLRPSPTPPYLREYEPSRCTKRAKMRSRSRCSSSLHGLETHSSTQPPAACVRTSMREPRTLNFAAFSSRLSTTCLMRSGSSQARGSSGSRAHSSASPASSTRGFKICTHSSTTAPSATRLRASATPPASRFESSSRPWISSVMRAASRSTSARNSARCAAPRRASPESSAATSPRNNLAKPLMLVSGVVSSWLTFARNSDFMRSASAIRSFCARSCSLRRASSRSSASRPRMSRAVQAIGSPLAARRADTSVVASPPRV